MQYWYVNGRWVRDRGLSQALHDAYRGLLMTGRHAVAFLFLELPPDQVDVNVHPTKAEVRFREPEAVRQLVQESVQGRLRAQDLTGRMRVPPAAARPRSAPPPPEPAWTLGGVAAAERPRGNVAPEASAPKAAPSAGIDRQNPPPAVSETLAPVGPPPDLPKAMQVHGLYLFVEVPEGVLVIDQHALH